MAWMGTPQFRALMRIEDPYEYRSRLTLPKYLVNATGDQFFLPDSWRVYYDTLPGETSVRYVPNADHGLKGTDALQSVAAFYSSILTGTPRPKVTWTAGTDGKIRVQADRAPERVLVWRATNPNARDFRLETLGPVFTSRAAHAGRARYVGDDDRGACDRLGCRPRGAALLERDQVPVRRHLGRDGRPRSPAARGSTPHRTAARRGHAEATMSERFTIGVDYGTESGRAVVVRVSDGAELASAVMPYPDAVIDQTLPGTGARLGDEWALQNPLDYLHVLKTAVPGGAAQERRRSEGRRRHRHRLHGVHDAAGEGRRHAADGAARVRGQPARVGQALEAPRGAAACGSHQRDRGRARRNMAAALRRQDLERVVPRQGAADPRGSAGDLPRRRSPDRGGRLGDLAPVRRRDAQHLHRRLQGELPGRRVSDAATISARSIRASRTWSRRS